MPKIIKGYLTNFSEDKNFAAYSTGYVNAMQAHADKLGLLNSARVRRDILHNGANELTPQEKKLYNIPAPVRKMIPADDVNTGVQGYTPEDTNLAPLGIGLGALAGAAALGYGAYRLSKMKKELKANGYYAFDNEITKDKCRNLDNPGRTRAQLRKQYPNARIIKGNTAYQLNPQEFKVAANFSQTNFDESSLKERMAEIKESQRTGLNKIGLLDRPTASEKIAAARQADSLATYNNRMAEAKSLDDKDAELSKLTGTKVTMNKPMAEGIRANAEEKVHNEMNKKWRTEGTKFPHAKSISEYNALVEKEQSGRRVSKADRDFMHQIDSAVHTPDMKKVTEKRERNSNKLKERLANLDKSTKANPWEKY